MKSLIQQVNLPDSQKQSAKTSLDQCMLNYTLNSTRLRGFLHRMAQDEDKMTSKYTKKCIFIHGFSIFKSRTLYKHRYALEIGWSNVGEKKQWDGNPRAARAERVHPSHQGNGLHRQIAYRKRSKIIFYVVKSIKLNQSNYLNRVVRLLLQTQWSWMLRKKENNLKRRIIPII